MNLLDLAAVALPAGTRASGLPFGVSLIGPAFSDRALLTLASTLLGEGHVTPGSAVREERKGSTGCPRRPMPDPCGHFQQGNRHESRAIAPWALRLGAPTPESRRSRLTARAGGLVAVGSLLVYLTWRLAFTLPAGSWNRSVAFTLIAFEALPLIGLVFKAVTLWSIDTHAPAPVPVRARSEGRKVTVLIPTYNEPVDVIAPTIAASVRARAGARDVGARRRRPAVGGRHVRASARVTSAARQHDHAKAGNLNHALVDHGRPRRAAGGRATEIIAVLDCDHVPLPTFLTATLGWFDDPEIALVQGPQAFYNAAHSTTTVSPASRACSSTC